MQIPVFPNSSYLVVIGATPGFQVQLEDASSLHNIGTFFCTDFSHFQRVAKIMRRMTGIFVFSNKVNAAQLSEIKVVARARSAPIKLITMGSGPIQSQDLPTIQLAANHPPERPREILTEFLAELVPDGLKDNLISATNRVFPTMFEGLDGFRQAPWPGTGFDHQINFSLVANEILGHCAVRAKIQVLTNLLPESRRNAAAALSTLQESVNQSIGIIGQLLVKVGMNAKVGLPTIFDLSKIPAVETLIFFPSVHVSDKANSLCLSLGFFNVEGGPLFKLGDDESVDSSGGIELL
jgi:hypothetical protein